MAITGGKQNASESIIGSGMFTGGVWSGCLLFCSGDLWTAPEVLRGEVLHDHEKRLADVYALGIIMKEVFTRTGPYTEFTGVTAKGME